MSMSISRIFSAYEVQSPQNRQTTAARTSRVEEKKDMVALSERAKDFKTARIAVNNTPDVREELTAPIKTRLEAGRYDVNSQMLADKIMNGLRDC